MVGWLLLLGFYLEPVLDLAWSSLSLISEEQLEMSPEKGAIKRNFYSYCTQLLWTFHMLWQLVSYVFILLWLVYHRICLQLYIGLSVLVSQFPSVNLYRCGGWFILAITLLYSVLFVIIYSETESLKMKFRQTCLSCGKNKLRHTKRKRTSVKWCSVSFFSEVYM